MGQQPRTLDPSLSARHYFGAQLRALRELSQLSQDQLGGRVFVGGDTIRRVETAERFPRRELAEACDRELGTDGILGRLWCLLERERADAAGGGNEAGRPASSIRVEPHRQTSTAAASMLLSRVPFLPGVLDRAALDWLLNPSTPTARPPGCRTSDRRVDDGDVRDAATAMGMFRELDHTHGAGRTRVQVEDYIAGRLSPMLGGTPVSHDVSARLYTLAAGFFELGGYQAVDLGADGAAQQRYLRALQLAQAAGDPAYGAYLLAVNIAHLALHCNHPDVALRMARAAMAGAGNSASPAVRAALHAVVARAHARMGQGPECVAEILAAEADLGRSDPQEEPAWIVYFTRAYLADEMAH